MNIKSIITTAAVALAAIGARAEWGQAVNLPTYEQVEAVGAAVYGEAAATAQERISTCWERVAQLGGHVPTNAAERTLANLPDAIYSVTNTDRFAELISAYSPLTYAASAVTNLRAYAFYRSGIERVSLPNVVTAGKEAFRYCTALKSVYLPRLTTAGDNAFDSAAIEELDLPELIGTSYQMMNGCAALRKVKLPRAVTLGDMFCYQTASIDVVFIPVTRSIGGLSFVQGSSPRYIFAPELTSCNQNTFQSQTRVCYLVLRPQTASTVVARFSTSGMMAQAGMRTWAKILCTSDDDGSDGYLAWDGSAWVFLAGDPDGYDPGVWDNL